MDGFVGVHRPIHAFYITQPIAPAFSATKTIKSFSSHSTIKSAHSVTTTVARTKSNSFSPTSSVAVVVSKTPPLIHEEGHPTIFPKNHYQEFHESARKDQQVWLAPLLGILGLLGVIGIAALFCLCKRRRRRRRYCSNDQVKTLPASHKSWASISTIQTSMFEGEKDKIPQPPPAYYQPKAQKRLTADTLVEEPSVLMLKNQYSPQLAFSPSLIAGEFQQQQQQEEKPPLPHMVSPSNTLIDNAGVLNEEKDGRRRIEIYDPQVNLQHDGPFDTPYSYQ